MPGRRNCSVRRQAPIPGIWERASFTAPRKTTSIIIWAAPLEAQGRAEEAAECLQRPPTGISEPVGAMYYNDQPPEMIYYQGLALLEAGTAEGGVRTL